MRFFLALCALCCVSIQAAASVQLPAEFKIRVGRLGKIEADSKTPVRWLNLHEQIDLIPDSSGKFAFVLGHQTGRFKIAAYTSTEAGPSEPAFCTVIVEPQPGAQPPPAPGPGLADPARATARLRFGTSGCTATIIGPRRDDGIWLALTAAHCTGPVGSRGQLTVFDGRVFGVTVTARNTQADLAWLRLDGVPGADLPFAVLANEAPSVGLKVWHQGFGVDRPGNREEGTVTGGIDSNGQIRFTLNVSSGDSGSGIFSETTGELVAVVCCTSSRGQRVSMWGGSSLHARKMPVDAEMEFPILHHPLELDVFPSLIPERESLD